MQFLPVVRQAQQVLGPVAEQGRVKRVGVRQPLTLQPAAVRRAAEPVRSSSLLTLASFRTAAVSHPSTTGGAVRLTAAMLILLSIRLRTRASRASAVRPPNTTARI